MNAINQWKEDVRKKGEKAKDINDYMKGGKNVKHRFQKIKNKKTHKK